MYAPELGRLVCAKQGCGCGSRYVHALGKVVCRDCHCTDEEMCVKDGGLSCNCPSDGCFPSTARVSLEHGESVSMSELQIGDRVKTGIHISHIAHLLLLQ